jgi:pyruvate/2-oxoglutarate dehydrogenase complex dihydrolipoamide acyltransferase (E2) component
VVLRSPIAGIVVEVHVNVGDTREPSGEPLVRVAGEGPSRVEARCSRTWPLAGARYEMVASNGMRYPLTYVSRSPTVDRRDGTIAAWFEPPVGEKLPHGLSGRLLVTVEATAGVAVVPARAVLLQGGQSFVVVQRGGSHQRYAVEVVASSGAEALVRGISPGELVAADAALAEAPPEPKPAPGAKPPADAKPEPKAEKKATPGPVPMPERKAEPKP